MYVPNVPRNILVGNKEKTRSKTIACSGRACLLRVLVSHKNGHTKRTRVGNIWRSMPASFPFLRQSFWPSIREFFPGGKTLHTPYKKTLHQGMIHVVILVVNCSNLTKNSISGTIFAPKSFLFPLLSILLRMADGLWVHFSLSVPKQRDEWVRVTGWRRKNSLNLANFFSSLCMTIP